MQLSCRMHMGSRPSLMALSHLYGVYRDTCMRTMYAPVCFCVRLARASSKRKG